MHVKHTSTNLTTVVEKMHSITFYHKSLKQSLWLRNWTVYKEGSAKKQVVPFCALYYCAIIPTRP